jgi:CubicO group peptidase (beta-lactamase class C family)
LAFTGIAAALLSAPYLLRLIWEGYPQATWPAPGSYASVPGGSGEPLISANKLATPDNALLELFQNSEGRALLAARDGKLTMEYYAPGISRETRLNSYSLAKSLIAALTLKAIAEGKIIGFETPLGEVLSELKDTSIGTLPLCRLLDMKSGITFESGGKKQASGFDAKDLEATKLNLLGPMGRLHMTGLGGVESRLVRPVDEPNNTSCSGGTFNYQNVNTALMGAVLERAYARPLQDILSEKIWKPAGAANADWRRYDAKLPVTPYCCIYARPMDWLRVAQFLLDNGTPEAPFLPKALWQHLMGSDLAPEALHNGVYSNFVYHNILDKPGETLSGPFAYFFGSRGQAVYLKPNERLAVVRFGGKVQLLHSTLYGVGRSLLAGQSSASSNLH